MTTSTLAASFATETLNPVNLVILASYLSIVHITSTTLDNIVLSRLFALGR